jgi:hypothetical protein
MCLGRADSPPREPGLHGLPSQRRQATAFWMLSCGATRPSIHSGPPELSGSNTGSWDRTGVRRSRALLAQNMGHDPCQRHHCRSNNFIWTTTAGANEGASNHVTSSTGPACPTATNSVMKPPQIVKRVFRSPQGLPAGPATFTHRALQPPMRYSIQATPPMGS